MVTRQICHIKTLTYFFLMTSIFTTFQHKLISDSTSYKSILVLLLHFSGLK